MIDKYFRAKNVIKQIESKVQPECADDVQYWAEKKLLKKKIKNVAQWNLYEKLESMKNQNQRKKEEKKMNFDESFNKWCKDKNKIKIEKK